MSGVIVNEKTTTGTIEFELTMSEVLTIVSVLYLGWIVVMRSIQSDNIWIVGVSVVVRVCIVVIRARQKTSWRVSFDALVPKTISSTILYRVVCGCLRSPIIWVWILIAWVHLTHYHWSIVPQEIVVIMDTSYSMSADTWWVTRSALWQEVVASVLETIHSHEQSEHISLWVIYFSWVALAVHPVSTNYDAASLYMHWWVPEGIDQSRSSRTWTALWEALILAEAMFTDSTEKKTMLIVTDWGVNSWIDPLPVFAKVGLPVTEWWLWINIVVVGVWSTWWWMVTVPTRFGRVDQRVEGVDRQWIAQVAQAWGWAHFTVWSLQQLSLVRSRLSEAVIDLTRYIQPERSWL